MDEALWAFGRMSGVVSMGLLTLAILLGIVNRSGRPLLGMPRFSVTLLHRNVSLLAVVFLVLHVAALLLDPVAQLRLIDVLVPFLGGYRPFWLGLGTVAFDILVAVVLTALLRHRIGQRAFRAVHWFSYVMWPLGLAHSIGDGTNGTSGWFLVVSAVSVVLVCAAVLWRLTTGFVEYARARQGGLP